MARFCLVVMAGVSPFDLFVRTFPPTVPYHFDDCSFVVLSKIRKLDSSISVFLFQYCFGFGDLLCFHTNFKMFYSGSMKNVLGNLIVIALNL